MEKNKNKKKLFAIIGASALAFVLTIALSVSITLAYFGGSGNGNATVTLGGSVEVGTALDVTGTATGAVPGQTVELSINAKLKTGVKEGADPVTNQYAAVALLVNPNAGITIKADNGWAKASEQITVEGTAYDVFVLGTEDALTVVTLTTTETALDKAFTATYTVDKDLKNDVAGTQVGSVTVTLVAIQNGTTELATAKSYTTLKPIFEEVAKAAYAAK